MVAVGCRHHGIGADPEQIRHKFGGMRIGAVEMLREASLEIGNDVRGDKTAGFSIVPFVIVPETFAGLTAPNLGVGYS